MYKRDAMAAMVACQHAGEGDTRSLGPEKEECLAGICTLHVMQ
jgi:hypothetical protein